MSDEWRRASGEGRVVKLETQNSKLKTLLLPIPKPYLLKNDPLDCAIHIKVLLRFFKQSFALGILSQGCVCECGRSRLQGIHCSFYRLF